MSGPARIATFLVLVVAVLGGGAALGRALDPSGGASASPDGGPPGDAHATSARGMGADHAPGKNSAAPPGVQVAQDGLRLVLDRTRLRAGERTAPLAFRIVDATGDTVRDFRLEHERRMHLILVRRDLAGFEHRHPKMGADGTWAARAGPLRAGAYRIFADFHTAGARRVLGADLHVGGTYRPQPLSPPRATTRTGDGLDVTVRAGPARAGRSGRVAFAVRDRGRPADGRLQPYLGARGHLVALREGDLAYLHTHPEEDALAFTAAYPSVGSYRLFVQFRYQGRVRTAAFTQDVPQ